MNDQAKEAVHKIIQAAVKRAGGNWKQAFRAEVELIDDAIKHFYVPQQGNIIDKKAAQIPKYASSQVRRPADKMKFTPEQEAKAREILRQLGMI